MPVGVLDYVGLLAYVVYQAAFLVLPVQFIIEHEMPPGSAVIITTEQVTMKTQA